MNFEKYTVKAQEVVAEATKLAWENENQQIELERIKKLCHRTPLVFPAI